MDVKSQDWVLAASTLQTSDLGLKLVMRSCGPLRRLALYPLPLSLYVLPRVVRRVSHGGDISLGLGMLIGALWSMFWVSLRAVAQIRLLSISSIGSLVVICFIGIGGSWRQRRRHGWGSKAAETTVAQDV